MERREKYFKIMSEKLPIEVHDAFADLTKRCLAYIPDKRPEAIEILHWLREIRVGGRNEGMNSIEIDLFTRQRVCTQWTFSWLKYERISIEIQCQNLTCLAVTKGPMHHLYRANFL